MVNVPRTLLALVTLPLGLACITANAQATTTCKDRVFIDSVYQNGMGGNNYEYFVQIRNQTSTPLKWTLNFQHMPKTISLFSPQLTGGTLQAHASKTIRFGKGTNGNVNAGTVKVLYDTPSGTTPSVMLSKCIG